MSPLEFILSLLGISVAAGFLGSLIGLGGGIVIVPVLTLLYGIDIRYAIGASIVSVIATSSGAICGAFLAGILHSRRLFLIFGAVMACSALAMVRRPEDQGGTAAPDDWADRLHLHGSYFDEAQGREVIYRISHTKLGLVLMYGAGLISGLLGIGSGALKVPAMDLVMRIPIKVSTATSNFMIGVTAAAGRPRMTTIKSPQRKSRKTLTLFLRTTNQAPHDTPKAS